MKKLLNALFVTTQGAYLSKEGETRVGAWIETEMPNSSESPIRVAPRVGAWIETSSTRITPA